MTGVHFLNFKSPLHEIHIHVGKKYTNACIYRLRIKSAKHIDIFPWLSHKLLTWNKLASNTCQSFFLQD